MSDLPDRSRVPAGWEAFPWGYLEIIRELGIDFAPVVVLPNGDGHELAYGAPGFREAMRSVLSEGHLTDSQLKTAIERAAESSQSFKNS